MMKFGRLIQSTILVMLFAVGIAACSKKQESASASSTTLSSVSLGSLPSISSALSVSSNSSSNVSQTYSGTPPTLATLGAADSNGNITSAAQTAIKKAFFTDSGDTSGGALLATIGAANPPGTPVSSSDRSKFWGSTANGPGGMGACQMAQGVGEAFGRLMESVGSTCYMKEISKQTLGGGAISRVSGSTVPSSFFVQGSSDKWLKVAIPSQMNVFIKVFGSSGLSANTYKVSLHFCTSGGTVTGYETYTVDTANGTFSAEGKRDESGEKGQFSLTAGLKVSGSSFAFDPTVARTATTLYSGTWGKYKGKVSLDGSSVTSYRWWTNGTSGNKDYAKALVSGTQMSDFSFLEGGFKGSSVWSGNSHNYYGAAEYSSVAGTADRYIAVSNNSYLDAANTYGPGGSSEDSFFSGTTTALAAPTVDLSGYSCSQSVDDEINFDMSSSAGQAIDTTCQGDRFKGYSMCYISDINTAMGKVQQSY